MPLGAILWLERRSHLELGIIDKSDGSGPGAGLADGMHKFDTDLVVLEDHALVNFGLGDGAHANSDVAYDAEVAFTAHNSMHHVWAVRDARPGLNTLEGASWRDVCAVKNNILNVSIGVLLHATGASRDPAAHRRVLRRVGLVSSAHTVLHQLAFEVLTHDASADTGQIVLLVNPLNSVHTAHIDRHDHSRLCVWEFERLGYISATTIRNEHDVVLNGELDNSLNLLGVIGVDDDVTELGDLLVTKLPDFLEAGTMRVHNTFPLAERAARKLLRAELFEEGMVKVRGVNIHVGLSRIFRVQVRVHVFFDIGAELGKILTTEHIAAAFDLNHFLLLVVLEARVAVTPALEVEVEVLDLTFDSVINDLRVALSVNLEHLRALEGCTSISHAIAEL